MKKSRVLVLGDSNSDLIIPVRKSGSQSSSQSESGLEVFGGGTAANTAVALARLGEEVSFIGTVGGDGFGRAVIEDFINEGVDTKDIHQVKDAYTSLVLAVILPDGDRDIFVWPDTGGAHTFLSPDDISEDMFISADWLHTSGLCLREFPVREAQLEAMRIAHEAGLTVSLDLNLRLESWGLDQSLKNAFEEAISYSQVVFGNGIEEIMPFTGESSIEAGSIALSERKRTVIARQGSRGALVIAPGAHFTGPAFSVEVVDTLGAGDAFNGGFIAAQLAGEDLNESVRWGNAVAALTIGKPGARGLPSREDLENLLT